MITFTEASAHLTEEQQRIVSQVDATFRFQGRDTSDTIRLWIQWQDREMLKRITLNDFTTSELLCLVALIGPIFSRVLGRTLGPHGVPDGGFIERPDLRLL